MSSSLLQALDQHLKIVHSRLQLLAERGEATNDRRRALAGVLARDARVYLRYGLNEKAVEYFAAAREIHPDGGLESAYSRSARLLCRCVGPRLTEQIARCRRRV